MANKLEQIRKTMNFLISLINNEDKSIKPDKAIKACAQAILCLTDEVTYLKVNNNKTKERSPSSDAEVENMMKTIFGEK